MSVKSRQQKVAKITREIAEVRKKDAVEQGKEAAKNNELLRVKNQVAASRFSKSVDAHLNKQNKILNEISRIAEKRAVLAKNISNKTDQLHRAEQELTKELDRERRKIVAAEKRRETEQLEYQKRITEELRVQKEISSTFRLKTKSSPSGYDVFISHASEDKESLVRPLAKQLEEHGHDVWFDETTLKVGDSLRQKIDEGLANSRYGIVVLSEAFFSKNWPQYELNGLVAKEISGNKVILPIWHKVSKDEVLSYSPTLADKVALNTAISSVKGIAKELSEVLTDNDG